MKPQVLFLVVFVALGCSSHQSKPEPVPSARAEPAAAGAHVLMPLSDMTKELMEHCEKAEAAFNKATSSLLEHDQAPSPRKVRQAAQVLQDARDDMRRCKDMAHGMHEKHLGEPGKTN